MRDNNNNSKQTQQFIFTDDSTNRLISQAAMNKLHERLVKRLKFQRERIKSQVAEREQIRMKVE